MDELSSERVMSFHENSIQVFQMKKKNPINEKVMTERLTSQNTSNICLSGNLCPFLGASSITLENSVLESGLGH